MKCIVSDFDGTFFDDSYEENLNLVKEFVKKGNIFIVATGRTYESIIKVIKGKDIPYAYLITSDGAVIYDENNNLIYEKTMDNYLKFEVLDFLLKEKKLIYIKFDNNKCVTNEIKKVSRILVDGKIDDKKVLCDALNKKFNNIYAYISEHWLDITYKQYNKLEAIKYLEKEKKLKKIYTIGNDNNDYSMIKYYNGYLVSDIDTEYNSITDFKEFIKKISSL